jgi:hypothetical protein
VAINVHDDVQLLVEESTTLEMTVSGERNDACAKGEQDAAWED